MSYHQGMQKGNLDSVKADEHGKIKKETVDWDRGTPRDATPPPPPGIRVRTTAVRLG